MMKRILSAAVVLSLLPFAASAMTDEEKAALEARKLAAEAVLADHSFFNRWKEEGAIDSVKTADKVKSAAEAELKLIDKSVADMRRWCLTKVFVNACTDDARKAAFKREREVRSIMVAADDVIRADRTRQIRERREANEGKAKKPIEVGKPHTKAPAEPMKVAPAVPKTPSKPMTVSERRPASPEVDPDRHVGRTAEEVARSQAEAAERQAQEAANLKAYEAKQREAANRPPKSAPEPVKPRTVREPSAPSDQHVGQTQKDVGENYARAEERRQQEDANLAAFEKKQQAARERLAKAEAEAAKRRVDREARKAELDRSLKERTEAQERYESRKGERDSGLAKYF
ncbi:MAG: hypothetical protein ACI4SY_07105 [Sutterella sp.]